MADIGTGDDRDPRPPLLSLILGYGPMALLPVAAVIVWTAPMPWPIVASWLAIWWASSLLIFLAGVRRGLSFRTPGGPYRAELATMLWLFVLGAGALVARTTLMSLTLLVIGYASVLILDPAAARRGEAPAHFERLRPGQMLVALAGLFGLLAWRIATVMPV